MGHDQKELVEGWMEVDGEGGQQAAWAMRFGLQQRDKVRVIDDFSIAGVNGTSLHERLKIFGIDDIAVAALIAFSMDSCQSDTHPTMLGKTMDLRSAYKQFGINKEDRERIRVATSDPSTGNLVLLMVNALPFGTTVSAFLRISMFLWFVGVVGLQLAWTSFYDDYTLISREDCAKNAAWAAECLFDLLGVLFAREGKKATNFDRQFGSLGVLFDLSSVKQKSFSITHTDARRQELVETLKSTLAEGVVSDKMLQRLRGRLLWFENFVCGRQANFLVAHLGSFMHGGGTNQTIDSELKATLTRLLERVEKGGPVTVSAKFFPHGFVSRTELVRAEHQ